MKIFRNKRGNKKTEKRSGFYQGSCSKANDDAIITNGNIVGSSDKGVRQRDYDFIVSDSPYKEIKFGSNRDARIGYKPNKYFYIAGRTDNAFDVRNRRGLIMYKSTKKDHIKNIYRDFLKDTEKGIKAANLKGEGGLDKELREAIKKEIRKQHKLHNIKKVSKIIIPTSLAIAGGAYLYNKNKKKKKDN